MTHRVPVGIHVACAQEIAEVHGYDQVVIYARVPSCSEIPDGVEWVTTYGTSPRDKQAAAQIGVAIKKGVVEPLERLRNLLIEAERQIPRSGLSPATTRIRKDLLARISAELAPVPLLKKEDQT